MATRKRSGGRSPRPSRAKARKVPTSRRKAKRPAARPSGSAPRTRERRLLKPETLRLRSIAPGITVDDLTRSIAFYTDVLGFIVSERWTDGGVLRGVMLKAGVSEIGLSQDDWAKGRDRKKGVGVRLWCETVQEVDAIAARVKAAGHPLTEEPKDQPWGRSFALDDPDGYHLTIARER
jgi:catechol 2,3-dioxygenase-like lactoylglutathione lyase family enzyme